MSWDNTTCPCGGEKQRETLICAACELALSDDPAMRLWRNLENDRQFRRAGAIRLLSLSRQRSKQARLGLGWRLA